MQNNKFRGNVNYRSNQGVLADDEYVILPYGSVVAKEWLLQQLHLQKHDMLGVMDKYNDLYNEHSGWLGGVDGESWEKGPYYLRGLVAVAYVLNDDELKKKAQKWLDCIMEMQRPNGFFGAESEGNGEEIGEFDWWPSMVVIQLMRDYYEATVNYGNPDERVINFLHKYFEFQSWRLDTKEFAYWANSRGADNIEVVLWYYNHIYNPDRPEESQWLITLANKLKEYTADWSYRFSETGVREHVVNMEQAKKYPAVVYQLTKSDYDRNAFVEGQKNININQGRIDTLPNADEFSRDIQANRGTELCAVVEGMLSSEISLRIWGDSWLADRIEKMAYNTLPTLYTPDQTGHAYFTAQNQALLAHGYHHAIHDQGDSFTFASPSGCECCFPNNGMGYAKFIQTMWMATRDNGLAAMTYGPNKVTAKVADGKTAVFDTVTNYPFGETINITYEGDAVCFPVKLHIPGWCKNATVQLNGEAITNPMENGFVTITRDWTKGDKITLVFPMEVRTSLWCNESVAVERGPLMFSTKIEEDFRKTKSNECRHCDYPQNDELPMNEVFTAGKWNYGIIFDDNDIQGSFKVKVNENIALQPFMLRNAPVTITVKGQLIPDWQITRNYVPSLPFGNVIPDESLPITEFELVPFGCARLKIAQIPRIAPFKGKITRELADADIYTKNNQKVVEFTNITLPYSEDYKLIVNYSGKGAQNVIINNKAQLYVNFEEGKTVKEISNLSCLIEDEWMQFRAGNFNSVAFMGVDVNIESIEVIPVSQVPAPAIISAERNADRIVLKTNITHNVTPYSIVYGTQSGNYTKTATWFIDDTANITGLGNEDYFFKLIIRQNGKLVSSKEFVSPASSIVPVAEMPKAEYNGDLIKSIETCFETAIVTFGRVGDKVGCKLAYGTESGKYDHEIYNFTFSPYYMDDLRADKIVVPGLENGKTYYIKMWALIDGHEVVESNEHSFVPGDISTFCCERNRLTDLLASAEKAPANPNLTQAIAEAKNILSSSDINAMDCDVAIKNLTIGMEDFN